MFAKDGEIYDFDGYACIEIGGAYGVDKLYRLAQGWRWFDNEQPSGKIKAYVEGGSIRGNTVDIVLSRTGPIKK